MKPENEVKSAYDELTPDERAAVLFSAQLSLAVQNFNELAHKAYNTGRLAPSTDTAQ